MKPLKFALLIFLFSLGTLSAEVLHIKIEGTIDLGLPPYIQRAVEVAQERGAKALILEINTFGGRLDAATQIKDIILNSKVTTVAFVNKRAISAGSLISLSCDKIAMTSGSSIGAATVVDMSGKKASEKAISYFRAEMGATAEKRGRNRQIAEGMVDEDVEIKGLSEKGKLITLTTEDAIKWGMADFIAEDLTAVLDSLNLSGEKIETIRINWAEKVVRFLTDPMVSSLLISLGMLGLFFEIKSPGWGVPGTAGVILLTLFFGSHYIVQLANVIEILLFIVGLGLLLLEIFVIPGFGVAGIAGIVCMILGLYLSLLGNLKHIGSSDFTSAAGYLSFAMILTFIGVIVLVKIFPHTGIWRRISLAETQVQSKGYRASRNYKNYRGKEGVAISPLRPAGIGIFDGERLDIVSEGEFIEKNTPVKITRVDGYRLVVRPLKKEENA